MQRPKDVTLSAENQPMSLKSREPQQRVRTTPHFFTHVRDQLNRPLVSSVGLNVSANLKLAHWRGQYDLQRNARDTEYHVVEYKLRGEATHRMDRKSRPLLNRTVTIQPANSVGLWTSTGVTEYRHIYLSVRSVAQTAESLFEKPADDVIIPEVEGVFDARFSDLIETCADSLTRPTPPSGLELDAWAQILGEYLLRNCTRLYRSNMVHRRPRLSENALALIIDMIENTLEQDLALADLAAQSGLSPYHFCRAFKRAMGSSPHQYVLDRRITRAREQLELGCNSLADIAYAVGFSSQAHMTSMFKKRVGVTPGRYRSERRS